MAEQRELGHDVGEIDGPARASLWGPIGGNGVREKTLLHRPLGLLPCDVTGAAVDDCLARRAALYTLQPRSSENASPQVAARRRGVWLDSRRPIPWPQASPEVRELIREMSIANP